MKQFYDNTMLTDYKKCPRYYFLRHIKGWRKSGTAAPLVFGLSWHSAMDVIWTGYQKVPLDTLIEVAMEAFEQTWIEEGYKPISELTLEDLELLGARTPMVAKEMLYNYVDRRQGLLSECTVRYKERPFAVPIYPNRDDIWYIGRRDKGITFQGDNIIIEHKTTTEYKKDGGFKNSWLDSWYPNSQCEGYLYSSRMEGTNDRYVWIDGALVHKKEHGFFKFVPVSATFATLDAWLWEVRDWIGRIEEETNRLAEQPMKTEVLMSFPRNTNECIGKFGACQFLDVCRGHSNPAKLTEAPAGFIHERWEPFKILELDKIGMKEE